MEGETRNKPAASTFTWLLAFTLLCCSILQMVNNGFTDYMACSWPAMRAGHWWTIFTYSLVHAGPLHLLLNLFALTLMAPVEKVIGTKGCAFFYIVGCMAGGLAYLIWQNNETQLIGESAGICAMALLFCLYFPNEKILFMFLPMRAWVTAVLFLLISFTGLFANGMICHEAHLAGAGVGMLAYLILPKPGWALEIEPPRNSPKTRPLFKLSLVWAIQGIAFELYQHLGHPAHEGLMNLWNILYSVLTVYLAFEFVVSSEARAMILLVLALAFTGIAQNGRLDFIASIFILTWGLIVALTKQLEHETKPADRLEPYTEEL
jgi:membrane associated rhomboid family serine protease